MFYNNLFVIFNKTKKRLAFFNSGEYIRVIILNNHVIMKRLLLFVAILSLLFTSCKSEQEKAFDAAKSTNELSALREFAASIDGEIEPKVKSKYDAAYQTLIQDSTLYADVLQAEAIFAKYNAEKKYIETLPKGIHSEEIKAVLPEHKSVAEAANEQISLMRKRFGQYKFRELELDRWGDVTDREADEYIFDGPDEYGKGNVVIEAKNFIPRETFTAWYKGKQHWGDFDGLVIRNCEGTYYLDDELKIHLTINETRDYTLPPSEIEYCEKEARDPALRRTAYPEVKRQMRQKYPAPKPRKLILYFKDEPKAPEISGLDSRSRDVYFKTVLR